MGARKSGPIPYPTTIRQLFLFHFLFQARYARGRDAPNNDSPSTETISLTPKYSAASGIAGE
jgi:hypothetical protein